MVTDLSGNINPETSQGIFSDDTRFLSYYTCYLNGKNWIRVYSKLKNGMIGEMPNQVKFCTRFVWVNWRISGKYRTPPITAQPIPPLYF
ncbi:MAG: hypothetical protein IGS49_23430 [Chlorogloeopsis fritschii C42_A2020_084]|nr:hypothetical protein [Chlorogloeopsis fritschii C42_A2020_084]